MSALDVDRCVCLAIAMVAEWSVMIVVGDSVASTIHRIFLIVHTKHATSSSVGQYLDSAGVRSLLRKRMGSIANLEISMVGSELPLMW